MTTRRSALSEVQDVLQSPAVSVLLALEADGFTLTAMGDRLKVKPISKLTAEQRADLERYRGELLTLLRVCDNGVQERRAAFSKRLRTGTGPLVFRDRVPYVPGICYSCADPLPHLGPGRCWRCSLAARLACHAPVPVELLGALDEARSA